MNSSISMNLSEAYTTTTVEFSPVYQEDVVEFVGEAFIESERRRIIRHLDLIRQIAKTKDKARVATQNNFPKGTGAAASASGFAALTIASASAAGLNLSEKELTILARIGSGSACRSIPNGFVLWNAGKQSTDSYAYSLYAEDYWDVRDVLAIVEYTMKEVLSTEGMEYVDTSPFLSSRLASIPKKIDETKKALKQKDFPALGRIIEADCVNMHTVMMTQVPPIFYWTGATMNIIQSVIHWRKEGLPVYFTIDAGPNVHLICENKDAKRVKEKAGRLDGIEKIITNAPAEGAHLVGKHLL